jgi:hypothetical protein
MYQKINRIIEITGWSFLILAWFFIALEMHFTFYRSIGFSLYAHPALFSLIASFCLWTITLLISRKANFAKFIFLVQVIFLFWCVKNYIPEGRKIMRQDQRRCTEYMLLALSFEVENYLSERGYPVTTAELEEWRSAPLPLSPYNSKIHIYTMEKNDTVYYQISVIDFFGDTFVYNSLKPGFVYIQKQNETGLDNTSEKEKD